MALVACPDCNKEISTSAPTCPNCGRSFTTVSPVVNTQPSKDGCLKGCFGKVVIAVLLVILLLLVLVIRSQFRNQRHPVNDANQVETNENIAVPIDLDFMGPFGLTWGQTPSEVKKTLSTRFRFKKTGRHVDGILGDSTVQEYSGRIFGIKTNEFQTEFYENQLVAVAVNFHKETTYSVSVRFEDIVKRMTSEFGAPTEIETPPGETNYTQIFKKILPDSDSKDTIMGLWGTVDDLSKSADIRDYNIQTGNWQPKAVWRFRNGAVVGIVVLLGDPDQFGMHQPQVILLFSSPEIRSRKKKKEIGTFE